MLMVLVIAFSILLVTAFCLKKKHLNLFELLGIWFTVMAVNSPVYTFFLANKHWISVPNNSELAIVRIIYTEILNPLLITWALNRILRFKKIQLRFICYIGIIGALFLGGLSLHHLGVVHFIPVGLFWYPVFKTFLLFIALCSVWFIQFLLRGDGISHASHTEN